MGWDWIGWTYGRAMLRAPFQDHVGFFRESFGFSVVLWGLGFSDLLWDSLDAFLFFFFLMQGLFLTWTFINLTLAKRAGRCHAVDVNL